MVKSAGAQIAVIIILGFSIYANSLGNKFVWDDEFLVKDNVYVKNPGEMPHFFTQTIGMGAGRQGPCYRPLQMVTYTFDYLAWRLEVRGYHLTNIALHILVALSLYWLASAMFNNRTLAFIAGILFVAHPIHTEAVDYISGRADLLCALFVLLYLIGYLYQARQKRPALFVLMLFSALAAVFSKEQGLVIPFLVLLYSYVFKKKVLRLEFLSALCICAAFIAARSMVISFVPAATMQASTFTQRLPGFFAACAEYIRLLFFPVDLHMEYRSALFSFYDSRVIMGAALLFLLVAYAVVKVRKNQLVSFSILWFFLMLLPVSNLYPINAYMAEHWLYMPSLGFFFILAYALSLSMDRSVRSRRVCTWIVAILAASYSYGTIRQNRYWKEPVAFYERTLRYAPTSARVYANLGKELIKAGQLPQAICALQRAVELSPTDAHALIGLAAAHTAAGGPQKAIILCQKAVSLQPGYAEAYYQLGSAYRAAGDYEKAIGAYLQAIARASNQLTAAVYYNALASLYAAGGDIQGALMSLQKAVALSPFNPEVLHNIKVLRDAVGNRNNKGN